MKPHERPFDLVGLGGCFDHLHVGHHRLLEMAFRLGKNVAIGLSTEELLKNKAYKDKIQSYEVRKKNLIQYIESNLGVTSEFIQIIPLNDPFGPAITNANLEAHISSVETHQGALMINDLRIKNGLKPLVLVIIPLELGIDGKKLSSTDIRKQIKN